MLLVLFCFLFFYALKQIALFYFIYQTAFYPDAEALLSKPHRRLKPLDISLSVYITHYKSLKVFNFILFTLYVFLCFLVVFFSFLFFFCLFFSSFLFFCFLTSCIFAPSHKHTLLIVKHKKPLTT